MLITDTLSVTIINNVTDRVSVTNGEDMNTMSLINQLKRQNRGWSA
jgi:hypothetical protein